MKRTIVASELEHAYEHLTLEQMREVEKLHKAGKSISRIACSRGLTRSFVHSYVRKLNSEKDR